MPVGSSESADLATRIRIKRVYQAAEISDGKRILVDRLWPRGVTKDKAHLYDWCKDIAPSQGLRIWYHADLNRWEAFAALYRQELVANHQLTCDLARLASEGPVTLVYASSNAEHNHAKVLLDHLQGFIRGAKCQDD